MSQVTDPTVAHKAQEVVAHKLKSAATQAAVDATKAFDPESIHSKSVARYPLPIRKLRVVGPRHHRVRLGRSLSSTQVGALRAGAVFAFSDVNDDWAKLSPLHYNDLQSSASTCCLEDFQPHNAETQGYCVTQWEGTDIFERPTDAEKLSVLSRYAAFLGI